MPHSLKNWKYGSLQAANTFMGPKTLAQVCRALQGKSPPRSTPSRRFPFKIVFKSVMTTSDEIRGLCREANASTTCIGLILWMHTFSPPQRCGSPVSPRCTKPFLHLHTQYNRDLPWSTIDMDFMNLNQAAPRRPRVRLHHRPPAPPAQGRRRLLERLRNSHRDRHMDPRAAAGLARVPQPESRPLRRQHARSRRHRRRQSRR